jgi:carboxymethylenebutenolidase
MSKHVEFTSKGGKLAGEIAEPGGDGKVGGVVLIQEWHGINDHIRSLVDRFAAAGYVTIAPDLYHGNVATNDDEAGKLMNALDFGKAVGEIGAAVQHVKEHPRSNGKVAVLGFCMGGALSFLAASNVPGLAAVVPFYGTPGIDKLDPAKMTAPILAHFAAKDDWAKPENAKAIKAKLDAAGKSMELHVYDAGHAFMRDCDPNKHDAPSAKKAWDRTLEFLKKHLA